MVEARSAGCQLLDVGMRVGVQPIAWGGTYGERWSG